MPRKEAKSKCSTVTPNIPPKEAKSKCPTVSDNMPRKEAKSKCSRVNMSIPSIRLFDDNDVPVDYDSAGFFLKLNLLVMCHT